MMVVDADGNPTYVGYRFAEYDKKIRIFEYKILDYFRFSHTYGIRTGAMILPLLLLAIV